MCHAPISVLVVTSAGGGLCAGWGDPSPSSFWEHETCLSHRPETFGGILLLLLDPSVKLRRAASPGPRSRVLHVSLFIGGQESCRKSEVVKVSILVLFRDMEGPGKDEGMWKE